MRKTVNRVGREGYAMKRNQKNRLPLRLLLLMPVLTLLCAALGGKLMDAEILEQSQISLLAPILAGLCAFALALYAALRSPQKKLLWGIGSAATYASMLILGNLLFFGDGFAAVWPVTLSVLVGGAAGGVFGSGKRRRYA